MENTNFDGQYCTGCQLDLEIYEAKRFLGPGGDELYICAFCQDDSHEGDCAQCDLSRDSVYQLWQESLNHGT